MAYIVRFHDSVKVFRGFRELIAFSQTIDPDYRPTTYHGAIVLIALRGGLITIQPL